MRASVIIPTKDKLSRLRLTLKALEGQIDQDVEVILVFDGCSRETVESFQGLKFAFPTRNIISEHCLGRAGARNLGIREARGEVLIFLDDDRIPAGDFIQKHLAGHEKGSIVLLGRRNELYLSEKEIQELFWTENFESDFKRYYQNSKPYFFYSLKAFFLWDCKNPLRYIIFSTGNVSIDREIISIVGDFDEGFQGWGQEDADLGYRIAKMKIPFYLDNSIENYHLAHSTNKENKRMEGIKNLCYFGSKYQSDLLLQLLVRIRKMLLILGV